MYQFITGRSLGLLLRDGTGSGRKRDIRTKRKNWKVSSTEANDSQLDLIPSELATSNTGDTIAVFLRISRCLLI